MTAESARRGRRRPVDLRLPRRERPRDPRVRARLRRRARDPSRAELSLDGQHPRGGRRGDRRTTPVATARRSGPTTKPARRSWSQRFPDDRAEARWVTGEIADALASRTEREPTSRSSIAPTRSRACSRKSWLRRGHSLRARRRHALLRSQEVKDVLAYLRLLANPADDVSLTRMINVPTRGIGPVSVAALVEAARAGGCSIGAILDRIEADGEPPPGIGAASTGRVPRVLGHDRPAFAIVPHRRRWATSWRWSWRETGLADSASRRGHARGRAARRQPRRADRRRPRARCDSTTHPIGLGAVEAFLERRRSCPDSMRQTTSAARSA